MSMSDATTTKRRNGEPLIAGLLLRRLDRAGRTQEQLNGQLHLPLVERASACC
jgi:hypothetical protein